MWRNQHRSRDVTPAIELIEWDDPLVGGDLKYRVGRGVEDPGPRAFLIGGEPVDDGGTTPDDVTDDGPARPPRKFLDDVCWEAVRVRGKRLGEVHACNLPVAGRAVFPRRMRDHRAP